MTERGGEEGGEEGRRGKDRGGEGMGGKKPHAFRYFRPTPVL